MLLLIEYYSLMNSSTISTKRVGRWVFFLHWLKNPMSVAAVSPSSPHLAKQMIAELSPNTEKVIELGGGTGAITQILLEHGILKENLLVLELNEELHQHLSARFPGLRIELGDARDLSMIASRTGYLDGHKADAVVSGLGLLSMPRSTQKEIVQAAFECLKPDGRLIQFTYGLACPVANEVIDELDLTSRRAGFTWLNMPPATVFVYRRRKSQAVVAKSMR